MTISPSWSQEILSTRPCEIVCQTWGLYLTVATHKGCTQVIDDLVTAINQGILYVHVYCFTIHSFSFIRRLTYIRGLSPDELRAELGRRIHQISARTEITHTKSIRWVIELSVDDCPGSNSFRFATVLIFRRYIS